MIENRLVNLGTIDEKNYHFDLGKQILLEEKRKTSYWGYILLPIVIMTFREIGGVLESTPFFESAFMRVLFWCFLLIFTFILSKRTQLETKQLSSILKK